MQSCHWLASDWDKQNTSLHEVTEQLRLSSGSRLPDQHPSLELTGSWLLLLSLPKPQFLGQLSFCFALSSLYPKLWSSWDFYFKDQKDMMNMNVNSVGLLLFVINFCLWKVVVTKNANSVFISKFLYQVQYFKNQVLYTSGEQISFSLWMRTEWLGASGLAMASRRLNWFYAAVWAPTLWVCLYSVLL